MRIVLLAHAPVRGGSTDLLFQVQDYFRQSHEVTTIFGEGAEPMDSRAADSTIFQARGRSWRERLQEYVRLVESYHPDIVYGISGMRELDLFRFLRCVRVRHVSSLEQHGFADIPFVLSQNRDYFEACTANSPDALEEVHRLTGSPTYLLPYRLPTSMTTSQPIAIPESMDAGRPIEVAFVGRLERLQKRAHWLPDIVRHCGNASVNLAWHIYGDGPETSYLQAKLSKAPNVTMHGWTSRDELYRRLPHHDLIFFCSLWEGLPIAMVEAMRCGLACVAPDIPAGIHWMLAQGGGWLYRADSARLAAQALASAASNRGVILQKRREALRLSAELFPPSMPDEYYSKLEASLKTLVSNGNALHPAAAPKFRNVPLKGYSRRLRYAAESIAHSPARFIGNLVRRSRKSK